LNPATGVSGVRLVPTRLDDWLENTSRRQYALIQGVVFGVTMLACYYLIAGRDALSAFLLGLVGGAFFGGIQYAWNPR
jgi:hypothetical protein